MKSNASDKHGWLLIGAIVALAAFLRFYHIGSQSFWTDEILSFGASTAPEGISFWKKLLYDVHGPFHTLIIHLVRYISESEGFLRAPSALAGTISVLLVYRWLVRLGRRDIAHYGALLLAVSPFGLYYSQELRYYSLMMMFALVSLILYERFLEEPSYRRGAMLGLALAAAALSHFSALFLPVGLFVHLLFTRRLRGIYLDAGLLAALILLFIVSPWIYREIMFLRGIDIVHISELQVEERLRGELTLNLWSYPYALYAFSVGYSFGPSLRELHGVSSATELLGGYWLEMAVVALLFGGLTVAGLWKSARKRRLSLFLSIASVALVLTTLAAALNIKVFNIRYLMVAFPVYLALLAYALPAARLPRLLLVTALCAVMLVSSWNYHTESRYARDDIRATVSAIRERETAGDVILTISAFKVIEYYYDGGNHVHDLNPEWRGEEGTSRLVREHLSRHERIWYIRCRHWDTDPDDLLLGALRARAELSNRWSFPGVELFLFARKS